MLRPLFLVALFGAFAFANGAVVSRASTATRLGAVDGTDAAGSAGFRAGAALRPADQLTKEAGGLLRKQFEFLEKAMTSFEKLKNSIRRK